MYLMRLDDASEFMNLEKWRRMELLLDRFSIKPIYGIIPNNQDPELLTYGKVNDFWEVMIGWSEKGWTPALHGYSHVFETNCGGINPVNDRSEFAGVDLERQREKIRSGYQILLSNGIRPELFFAPAHTFDKNTLEALEKESKIRIISDTIADDIYYKDNFFFVPQQSGHVRILPFKVVTFCYHPNIMTNQDFINLETFLSKYSKNFVAFDRKILRKRSRGIKDIVLEKVYFARRRG